MDNWIKQLLKRNVTSLPFPLCLGIAPCRKCGGGLKVRKSLTYLVPTAFQNSHESSNNEH